MANEEQAQESTQQNAEESLDTQQEQVVSKEMVELFGVPKSFEGKPIEELAKSYKSVNKEFTKRSQELSELKKLMEQQAQNDIHAPDPLDFTDNSDYEKALNKYVDTLVEKKLQNTLSPLQSQFAQQQTQNVFDAIQKQLPDANAEEIAQEWMDDMGYTPDDGQKVFQGDINRVIKSIVNWQKARQLDDVKVKINKESGNKAIDAIKKSLKIQPSDSDLNSVTKKIPNTGDDVISRIVSNLENENKFIE